jgi:hypothetical protein
MFQLSKKEWLELITICDQLPEGAKFSPALPYAFTEHGVTMLASVLKSKKAIQMNIAIVRAFIALKQFALDYKELAEQIKELKETTSNHHVQGDSAQIYFLFRSMPERLTLIKDRIYPYRHIFVFRYSGCTVGASESTTWKNGKKILCSHE